MEKSNRAKKKGAGLEVIGQERRTKGTKEKKKKKKKEQNRKRKKEEEKTAKPVSAEEVKGEE